MPTRFVLLDFENVQPKDLSLLKGRDLAVKVFLGANQKKIPVELAQALQELGPAVEYIRIEGNGPNALDFHIAYYLGRLAAATSGSRFHVISKDTGFDPLIKHLAASGIQCTRSASISATPAESSSRASIPEMAEAVIADLIKRKSAKPKTLKTLRSTIGARLRNQCGANDLDEVIAYLTTRGVLQVVNERVQYELPS